MKQQQNKHSNKNYKRNTKPAKLICSEWIAINNDARIIADFKTYEEMKEYAKHNNCKAIYEIKTYKLNQKQIQTKQQINKEN